MISVKKGVVHIEGDMREVIGEWCEITAAIYRSTASHIGTSDANKMFVNILVEVCNEAAAELKEGENE